jgi:hypothetical protein
MAHLGSLALALTCGVALSAAPRPLPLAPSFSVRFAESFTGFPAAPSSGAWFYDWPRHRWRAEHDAPQSNNFCACASNASASCALIFTDAGRGGLYVDFPDAPGDCCHLCGDDEGCTVLRPDWLSASAAAVDAGPVRGCEQWCVLGDQATADCLSYPPAGGRVPCAYDESFNFSGALVTHTLAFDASSYREGDQSDALFAIRPECAKDCPKLFPATCG